MSESSRRRHAGRSWLRALLLCCWLLLAVPGAAQSYTHAHEVAGQQVCSVQLTPFLGGQIGYGLGFVRVELLGLDRASHRIEIEVGAASWSNASTRVRRTFQIGPGERQRAFLPLATSAAGMLELELRIDGVRIAASTNLRRGNGLQALLVAERAAVRADALGLLQRLGEYGAEAAEDLCAPGDLPNDWRLLTAYPLILVDGQSQLAGEAQEVLRRYVHAGGVVCIAGVERLPAGPLRSLGEAATAGVQRHGLGACRSVGAGFGGPAMASIGAELTGWMFQVWPVLATFAVEQPIAGLGEAPVRVFLFVILVFAILAGPVNFYVLRKRKQPLLALLTVPVLGFGTALAMFAYGYFRDGFDVRGGSKTWTLLDQRRHEVVGIAAQTLFSGMSRADLQVPADTIVLAPRAQMRESQQVPDQWRFDADRQVLDGAFLPSRAPTPLVLAVQEPCRARARVRDDGKGGRELLVDGFQLAAGQVVLRDAEGKYWAGDAANLRPRTDRDAQRDRRNLTSHLRSLSLAGDTGVQAPVDLVDSFLPDGELPVGSYFAVVASPPWRADLLAPEARLATHHLLVGLLAPEDFLR